MNKIDLSKCVPFGFHNCCERWIPVIVCPDSSGRFMYAECGCKVVTTYNRKKGLSYRCKTDLNKEIYRASDVSEIQGYLKEKKHEN